MIRITMEPWGKLSAIADDAGHQAFMRSVASRAAQHFKTAMGQPGSGRLYDQELRTINGRVVPVGPRGRPHVASSPGAYPASDTGGLRGSIRHDSNAHEAKVGTTRKHAIYLRKGTSRMARRKMSDDALKETLPANWARKTPYGRLVKG